MDVVGLRDQVFGWNTMMLGRTEVRATSLAFTAAHVQGEDESEVRAREPCPPCAHAQPACEHKLAAPSSCGEHKSLADDCLEEYGG